MEEEHNVFDEMADFETKMYQFLDPPGSPEVVPSPDGRRVAVEQVDGVYNNYPGTSASANFFASPTDPSIYSSLNNGEEEKVPPKWFCTQCNRSFAAQFALDQHRRFKHQGYKIHCRHCPHTSTNGYALFLHVQREHSDVEGNGYTVNGIKSNTKKAINARRKRRAVKVLTRQPTMPDQGGQFAASFMSSQHNYPTASQTMPAYRSNHNDVGDIIQNAIAVIDGVAVGGGNGSRKANGALRGGKARKRTAMKIVRQAGIPSLDCEKCGKKFAFHSGLRMHTKMVHSGFRFTCQYCGLHFTNGYAIHRHVNIVHNVIGAVRNSGFSAATPEPEPEPDGVADSKDTKPKDIVCVVPIDSPTTKINSSLTNDDSTNHIRLRLRRKALPSKAVSSLEWAMDIDAGANTASASSTAQTSRRFSAPVAGSSMLDNASNCSSPEPNDISDAVANSMPIVECSLCPFKTDILDSLKLHSFKHSTSFSATANSSLDSSFVTESNVRKCPYCSYCTNQQSAYIVHASSHFTKPTHFDESSVGRCSTQNKTSTPSSPTMSVIYRCTYCDRRLQSSLDLAVHEKRHTTRN